MCSSDTFKRLCFPLASPSSNWRGLFFVDLYHNCLLCQFVFQNQFHTATPIDKTSKCDRSQPNILPSGFACLKKAKRLETAKLRVNISRTCDSGRVASAVWRQNCINKMSFQIQGMTKRKLVCYIMKYTPTGSNAILMAPHFTWFVLDVPMVNS